MDFRFTEEEVAFKAEVHQWLKQEIPQRWTELDPGLWEETEESWALSRQFQRKLGQKGWLAPAYPKQYGGLERSHMKRLMLAEELAYNRAPISVEVEITVNWVAPTIILFGNERQKKEYGTRVAKGEIIFCIGYSVPNAGSDLAALQTRAVKVGDEYIINGQKIWCSYAHLADYCWLAVRTDPNVSKHKGISMFIVDMKTPGVTVRPLINILNHHSFNEVFFDDVRIPRDKLAEMAVENEILRMMCYRIAWMFSKGIHPSYESSMTMVFSSELRRRLANVGMHIMGHYGELDKDSKWAPLNARIMRMYLSSVSMGVGGGSNEIQRNIIAMRGLGLPRG